MYIPEIASSTLSTGAKWMLPLLLRNEKDNNWLGLRGRKNPLATVTPEEESSEKILNKNPSSLSYDNHAALSNNASSDNTSPHLVTPLASSKNRKITVEELKAHNVPGAAWFAIRAKVYDLTAFIGRHPGGRDILHVAAGRDVTQMFEATHGVAQEMVLK